MRTTPFLLKDNQSLEQEGNWRERSREEFVSLVQWLEAICRRKDQFYFIKTNADEKSPSNKLEEFQRAWICLSYSFLFYGSKISTFQKRNFIYSAVFLMYNRVKEDNKSLEAFETRLFLSLLSVQWQRLGEMPHTHHSHWLLLYYPSKGPTHPRSSWSKIPLWHTTYLWLMAFNIHQGWLKDMKNNRKTQVKWVWGFFSHDLVGQMFSKHSDILEAYYYPQRKH